MKFKRVNILLPLIVYYKFVTYLFTKHGVTTMLHFVNANIYTESNSNGSKSLYGPMLHSHAWLPS
jgi:hypothetical protein